MSVVATDRMARSELEKRLYQSLETSVESGVEKEAAVAEALSDFTAAQLRVMYTPIAEQRYASIARALEMKARYGQGDIARGKVTPADATDQVERTITRNVEHRVAAMVNDAQTSEQRRAAYVMFTNRTFLTGDGREVPILDATPDDIRTRLDLLRGQVNGINKSIKLYERILSDFQKTPGAKVVRDLALGDLEALATEAFAEESQS